MPRGVRWALGLEINVKPTVGGAQGLSTLAAGHSDVALSNVVSIALTVEQGSGDKTFNSERYFVDCNCGKRTNIPLSIVRYYESIYEKCSAKTFFLYPFFRIDK
jgi:hypothetical protein